MPTKYIRSAELAEAQAAKKQATTQGDLTYRGRECKKCRNRERYTSNGGCIECANKDTRRVGQRQISGDQRYAARKAGAKTFDSLYPCNRCGTSIRYTSSCGCVECIKSRVSSVRTERAAVFHSTTTPLMWINLPPSPETAHFYAMCPTLAAYGGQWHCVYTDAQHLGGGVRLYPGCDVFKRPAPLQVMLNDKTNPGHEIARHLIPAYYPALRAFNLKVRGL